ncbi:hypothetical protein LCGC14_0548440 [marine sediment metagenome]|uniref:HNH nuclease domain-containing protein n=1 Tax=marine sediment metagenome TaxID=412755 RepID=A0A0F9UZ14_9ZZZZ
MKERERILKREQRIRYRKKYPEKVKEERRKYLDRKLQKRIKEEPSYLYKLKGKLLSDFDRLTRLTFKDKLEMKCKNCGSLKDLHIHHKQYKYPIVEEDLVVLCRPCHILEHQRVHPKF